MTNDSGQESEVPVGEPERSDAPGDKDDEDLAHDTVYRVVTRSVKADNNALVGNHFTVSGDLNFEGRGHRSLVVTADITAAADRVALEFVDPPYLPKLLHAVKTDRIAVLSGAIRCGKRTAAVVALRRCDHHPILQIPIDVSSRDLVSGIESACRRSPRAGFLIESVDSRTLSELAGFEMHRLIGLLQKCSAAVVLTAEGPQISAASSHGLFVIESAPPDAHQVTSAIARARGLDHSALATAIETVEQLPLPISPGTAAGVVDALLRDPARSVAELVAQFTGRQTEETLAAWLNAGPSPEQVASLAVAAALHGVPRDDSDAETAALAAALSPEPADKPRELRIFTANSSMLPPAVVGVVRRTFGTHFGRHAIEVLEVLPPHSRDAVVTYLWSQLGPPFRRPFMEWLRDLPGHQRLPVRIGAAVTAGVLFAADPVGVERTLLRPWGLDGRRGHAACAGLALGVPVALGNDPTPARSLAKAWGLGDNIGFRLVSTLAYGGLLGAWDSASAAPTHLWRIGLETPELRVDADLALASLVGAGAEAGRVRATVASLLLSQVDNPLRWQRVFEIMPLVLRRLTAGDELAQRSLDSLMGTETEARTGFARLIAAAFTAPAGHDSAWGTLRVMLQAVVDSRVSREVICEIIRDMKKAARDSGTLPSLGSQLEHALTVYARDPASFSEAAQSMLKTFFTGD